MNFLSRCEQYILKNVLTKRTNEFWKDVLLAWIKYINSKRHRITNEEDIRTQPLWYNDNLHIGNKPINHRNYENAGIHVINDLLDENGNILTFEQLKSVYSCKTHFLEYAGISKTLKEYCNMSNTILH